MNREIGGNKRSVASEKINGPTPHSPAKKISTMIRNMIISQLEAAAPASLPMDVLLQGIHCTHKRISVGNVLRIIQGLERNGVILEIGESGFCNRYGLVEYHEATEWSEK